MTHLARLVRWRPSPQRDRWDRQDQRDRERWKQRLLGRWDRRGLLDQERWKQRLPDP